MFQDRIKSLRRVKASELVPNPKNWRTHPDVQRSALSGILSEVGIADAVIARELDDGRLMLIDGHLRTEVAEADQKVPVLVLDVTEEEADKILLTLDPLAGLASANVEMLESLLTAMPRFEASEDLNTMLTELATQAGIVLDGWETEYLDDEEIGEYDDQKETAVIKVVLPRQAAEEAAAKVERALSKFECTIQVL